MKLPHKNTRLVLGIAIITGSVVLAHLIITYAMSMRASHPQQALINSALLFLNRGDDPQVVMPEKPVDIESGKTWIVVTDAQGITKKSAAYDGEMPIALGSCKGAAEGCFFVPAQTQQKHMTIQIAGGAKQAVLVEPWQSATDAGYILVGRSREEVDAHWLTLVQLLGATWLAGVAAFWFVNRTVASN